MRRGGLALVGAHGDKCIVAVKPIHADATELAESVPFTAAEPD